MLPLFIILTVLFAVVAIFLAKELLKKFGFMRDFVQQSNQLITWKHGGWQEPKMYNIVLQGQKPFSALIGFNLGIPLLHHSGFDYFGFVRSGEANKAVVSLYLGKGPGEFLFFVNTDTSVNPITVTATESDQQLSPHVAFRPHWYQRLGFYG